MHPCHVSAIAFFKFSQPSQSVREMREGFIPPTTRKLTFSLFIVRRMRAVALSIVSPPIRRRLAPKLALGGITL